MGFLQVILLILKIIGILLASVIGLLLLVTAVLLFVPVRYRLQGHKTEDYAVEAKVSWLLHLIRARIEYTSESKLFYEVHILWFLFLSSDEAWKAAKEAKQKRKAEEKAKKQKEKRAKAKAKRKKQQQKSGKPYPRTSTVEKAQEITPLTKTQTVSEENSFSAEEPADTSQSEAETEKKNWFKKILEKIRTILQTVREKCRAIRKTIEALWKKADTIVAFLKDETNKAAFRTSWTTLVQILKHLGPTKIRGYLAFGMEDPATTGYILAVLGIFYGKYGKSFSIRPNFEEKQLESEIKAKGRIRMSRLLYLALKLWRNKEFKGLIDNIKQLKSDTKTNGG